MQNILKTLTRLKKEYTKKSKNGGKAENPGGKPKMQKSIKKTARGKPKKGRRRYKNGLANFLISPWVNQQWEKKRRKPVPAGIPTSLPKPMSSWLSNRCRTMTDLLDPPGALSLRKKTLASTASAVPALSWHPGVPEDPHGESRSGHWWEENIRVRWVWNSVLGEGLWVLKRIFGGNTYLQCFYRDFRAFFASLVYEQFVANERATMD